eukprot:5480746-Ditylum_brightwellii.AAC.1
MAEAGKQKQKEYATQSELLQDYTHKEYGKCQKHGADENVLDSNMEELDALQEKKSALAPDKDDCGGV